MAGYIQASDLERVAAMLADNYGLRVICKGSKCETKGKTIFLPSLPPDRTNPKVMQLIRYFLDHEVGHLVGKSDFDCMDLMKQKHGRGAAELINCLEDVRVERLMAAEYAGCGVNLTEGGSIVREKQEELMASTDPADDEKKKALMHPVKQILSSLYLMGRGEQPLSFIDPQITALLAPFEDEVSKITEWAHCTADLLPLADRIVEAYKQQGGSTGDPNEDDDEHAINSGKGRRSKGGSGASGSGSEGGDGVGDADADSDDESEDADQSEPADQDQEEPTSDSDDEDEDQAQDGPLGPGEEGDADGDDEVDDGDDASGDGDDSDGDDADGDDINRSSNVDDREPVAVDAPTSSDTGGGGSGGAGSGGGKGSTSTAFEDNIDYADVSSQIANAVAETIGEVAAEAPLDMIRPVTRGIDTIQHVPEGNPPKRFVEDCKAAGGSMRQKLAQLLMSESMNAHVGGLRRGKPDPRALSRLVSGSSKHVFKRRIEVPAPDTACFLLIDRSGSMNGTRIEQATMAAAAFAHVLDQCKHASMIAGFDDSDNRNAGEVDDDEAILTSPTGIKIDREDMKGPGIRTQGITLWKCKGWTEPFRETMKRLYSLMTSGGGGTPLAEAMHMAAAELNTRKEKRKVLIVFTDGAPGFYGGDINVAALPQEHDDKGQPMWQDQVQYNPDGGDYLRDSYGRPIYKQVPVTDPAASYVRKIAMECEKSGIEVVMVGIGTDAVKRLHTKHAVVNDLASLATTTMTQLTKALHAGLHR